MANKVLVNEDVCKGCGLCVAVCPKKIMLLDRAKLNAKGYNPAVCERLETCIACGMCAIMCPDSAIKVERG